MDSSRRRSGGGGRAPSPPVGDLLEQLRVLGLNHSAKTYAGLAAAGRSTSPSPGGYSGGKERGASAFFRRQQGGAAGDLKAQQHGTPAAGSVTPPSRPAARVSTPGSGASPYLDDDALLFQMSGLKPLRTSSRLGAQAAADRQQQQQPQQPAVHRTKSAPVEKPAAERTPPLSRAFTFAGQPSPRTHAAPLPTVSRRRPAGPPAEAPAEAPAAPAAADNDDELVAELEPAAPSPARSPDAGAAAAAPQLAVASDCESDDAADAAEATEAGRQQPASGWSEELLNWMLSEKAGLLVEAQRAQRRQQELAAEVERLRAAGGGAEREVQRLTAERRTLLDRVQALSAAEADAAARAERLAMENDALAAELQHSQEVCREMLAARRAARDALSEVSAQNARLLAAYVEKKQEAAGLRDALRQQQRQAEARIRALQAQLQAAQVGGAAGQLRSPPPSPPLHGGAPPAASCSSAESDSSEQAGYGASAGPSGAATPQHPGAALPGLGKENAHPGGNNNAPRGQQPGKSQWDDERTELLSLLERLQDQLSMHAERHGGPLGGVFGGCGEGVPPPSPACQPDFGEEAEPPPQQQMQDDYEEQPAAADMGVGEEWAPSPAPPASGDASPAACRHGSAASNLEASFAAVSGSGSASGSGSPSAAASSGGEEAEGGSPAVTAHHLADSPLPPHSATRSGAPSPPSVRQQRPAHAEAADDAAADSNATPGEASPVRPEQEAQRACSSAGGSQTLEAFLGAQPASSPPPASGSHDAASEQQRRLQAERRAAELEAELERLRLANAAAEERAQREAARRGAEAAKSAGNAAFQAQRFEDAVQQYSAGLERLQAGSDSGDAPEDPALAAVLHCNRAAAHHACGRYLDALADCYCAAARDAGYSRVYHRRADAYWALGAYDAAAQDLAQLVRLGAGPDVAARLADARRRAAAQHPVNHYAVLGVKPAATPGEVRGAYRQLALRFHPDKAAPELGAPAAEALFKLLSQAYGVLSDGEQRRLHDIAQLRHKYRRFYSYAAS